MKTVSTHTEFIIKKDTPVLELKGANRLDDSGSKLLEGTVVKGDLKKLFVKNGRGIEVPVKMIALAEKKNNYIIPESIDVYIGQFANADGLSEADKVGNNTIISKTENRINFTLKYILPLIGAGAGFYFAKRKGFENKELIMSVVGGALIGATPFALKVVVKKIKKKRTSND